MRDKVDRLVKLQRGKAVRSCRLLQHSPRQCEPPQVSERRFLKTAVGQASPADWKEPSEHSVVCSAHFAEPCFEPDSALALAMGLEKRKKKLKPDAVPTLFDRPSVAGGTEEASASSRKRQRSITLSTPSPSNLVTCKPKKTRVAFEKRERARVSQIVTIIISRHFSFIHASQIVQELTTEATQPSELETNVGEEQDREEETSLLPHDTHSTIGVQACVEKKMRPFKLL